MQTRERRIDVGEVTLAVTEAGPVDGSPVLLLHGFPDARGMWRQQLVALAAAGHRVVAPDLRGFGDSDRPTDVQAYAMRLLVDDVTGLMDALDIDRVALVGHDWGALLAWAVAMSRPERVDRLVAVSVGHPSARAAAGPAQQLKGSYALTFLVPGLAERTFPAGGYWLLRHFAWRGASPADTPDLARQIEHLSRPGALTAALGWYRANLPLPRPGRRRAGPAAPSAPRPARTVGCPVMGVWSTGDPFLTEAQMTGSARYVTGPWRYERIEGVGHWVPVEAAQRPSALLVDFLRPGGGAADAG
jgi:pimeloyl-ACP methyl ester carboxylesterase